MLRGEKTIRTSRIVQKINSIAKSQPEDLRGVIERSDAGTEEFVFTSERDFQAILCYFKRRNRLRHGCGIGNGAVDER